MNAFLCLNSIVEKHERDVLLMRHQVGVTWPDKSSITRNVGMCVYGENNGFSAMAKMVGLPCAIATKMVLEGKNFDLASVLYII